MTFITSSLAFGSYTFPYGMRLQDRQQDTRIDVTDIPFTAGVSAPAGLTGQRTIRLTGMIGGYGAVDSAGAYIQTKDQLEAELQLMMSWLESGYQRFTKGDSDGRYCYAQKSKAKATYKEAENGLIAYVDIELIVADPRWFATAVQSTGQIHHGGGDATKVSNGSGLVYPKVVFTANGDHITNPTFTVHPGSSSGGSNYVKITLTTAQMSGGHTGTADVITIDCDPANRPNAVLLNGAPALWLLGNNGCQNTMGNQAFFPYMVPGNNLIHIDPDSSAGVNSYGVLSWSDTWVF